MRIGRNRHVVAPGEADHADVDPFFQDEAELLAAARRDPHAFGALYERYYQAIYLYCFRRLGTPEQADDATSTVFLKAYTNFHRFTPDRSRPGATFRSWLFTIAHNVIVDVWRRRRPQVSLDAQGEEVFPARFIDTGKSPEDLAIDAESGRSVRDLLAQLPERQRQVVELRLAGLSSNEVANALDLTVAAAKSLQFRAYRALRELLQVNSTELVRETRQ